MSLPRTIAERLALWCLRAVATALTLAGAAVLVASAATSAAPFTGGLARLLPAHAVRVGAVLVIGGVLALWLATSRSRLFRSEGLDPRTRRAEAGARGLVLALLAIPPVMLWQLRPLAGFWRDTFALLAQLGPWEIRGGDNSGLVLAPLFGVLALPMFETLSAAGFVAACAFLLLIVATRSRLRLRAVLACAALLGACAMGSLLGDDTMRHITPAIERMVRETTASWPAETAQALAAIERYHAVTGHAARVLAFAWIALACFVPVLILRASSQARSPASPDAAFAAAAPSPFAPASVPPAAGDDRERFYADAARLVDEGGAAGARGRPMLAVVLVALALLGLFALVSGFGALATISRLVTR